MSARKHVTPEKAKQMLDAMRDAPRSLPYLAKITGITDRVVSRWLSAMKTASVVRVAAYAEDSRGRMFTRLWGPGPGEDAPRGGPRWNAAQRMARVRQRRRRSSGLGLDDFT